MTLRRRSRITWTLGSVALALCGWFALATPTPSKILISNTQLIHEGVREQATPPLLNIAAFERAVLWAESAVAEESVLADAGEQKAAAPRVRLELLALITESDPETEEDIRSAAIYDPQTDRVWIVNSGERAGRHGITTIEHERVLVDSDGQQTILSLTPGRSDGPKAPDA